MNEIEITDINYQAESVMFRTSANNLCKLHRLGLREDQPAWGFVYLTAPNMPPIHTAATAQASMRAATKAGLNLFTAPSGELFKHIIDQIPN